MNMSENQRTREANSITIRDGYYVRFQDASSGETMRQRIDYECIFFQDGSPPECRDLLFHPPEQLGEAQND